MLLLLSKTLLSNRIRSPIALTLVAALFVLFVVVPQPAHAQISFGAVITAAQAVVTIITNTIGPLLQTGIGILNTINKVTQAFSDLWQKVVYPLALINRALSLSHQLMTTFTPLALSIHNINVLSATLPNPTSLESVMRDRSTGDFSTFDQDFRQTYQQLPAPTDMDPGDRQRVDMSDAMSMDVLKQLKASDQVVDQTLQAASIIEQEATQQAPGSAAFLSGAGMIAAVENQATMQRMLAALLRDEAAVLAESNSVLKRHSDAATQFRNDAVSALK
jgi:hypothetical protein